MFMIRLFVMFMQVMFIGLKLGNVILWSWWLVMSPFWIFVLCCFLGAIIVELSRND